MALNDLRRSADETAWRDFWLTNVAQERGERSSQWKQDGVKALSEYADKEQATRILTVKLRAERLAREAMSGKRDQKKSAKAQAENHRLAAIAAGRCRMPVKLDERRH
jgi:hypothetical protein